MERIKTSELNNLESLKTSALTAEWDSKGNPSGRYTAAAIVSYDAGVVMQNGSFRIGDYFIEIYNYTKMVEKGKISPFEVNIESMWNDPIPNVYATILIRNSTDEFQLKTISQNLAGWGKSTLIAYWDATSMAKGNYSVDIDAFYSNDSSSLSGNVEVYELGLVKEKSQFLSNLTKAIKENKLIIILVCCILVLIASIIGLVVLLLKKKPEPAKISQKKK
jgi:hypothetical protein